MSDYLKQWKKEAITILEIPGFQKDTTIKAKVHQPRLMAMTAEGKIPNPLMSVATKLIRNEVQADKIDINETAKMIELYCRACMVEPTFDEVKDIITDEQMYAVFDWAMFGVGQVEPFRTDKENGTSNNDGKGVQKTTK